MPINELLILITAIIFFLLGKYSNLTIEKEVVNKISKSIKTHTVTKPGPIDYKSEEEIEYEESEEAKDEKVWDKLTGGKL